MLGSSVGSSARWSTSATRRCSNSLAFSIVGAARSAASWSSSVSSAVNSREVRVPTCSTPITRPSISSGTPSRERMPFSRRIGL